MLNQRLLAASILLVLCGAASAAGQPDSSSAIPNINGGTYTPAGSPGVPPGYVVAPAARFARAGVNVLVDRPSALQPSAPLPALGNPPDVTMLGLQSRPSALLPTPTSPSHPTAALPADAAATARPRATAEAFAIGSMPASLAPLPRPAAIASTHAATRHVQEKRPAPIVTRLPDITVHPEAPAEFVATTLPAVPMPSLDSHVQLSIPEGSLLVFDNRPATAALRIAHVGLTVSDTPMPDVDLATVAPRFKSFQPAMAVDDLAPSVAVALSRLHLIGVERSAPAQNANPLIALRSSAPAGGTMVAFDPAPAADFTSAARRSGLRPDQLRRSDRDQAGSSSPVDVVLAQVAVLERQVALQQAQNDQRANEVALEMARLRQQRARLAAATQVAMEQYVDTSPIIR